MASVGASAVLGLDVTANLGASTTPFMAPPFALPTNGPTHWPPGEQHLLPPTTLSFLPGHRLVLPALPGTPLVAGDAGHGPIGTGACNIMDQVRSERGRPQPPQMKTFVPIQGPLNGSAPGALSGGAVCPAPVCLEASAVETVMPTSTVGSTQASDRSQGPGLPPSVAAPAAQLASIVHLASAGPKPHGASRATLEDFCNHNSAYLNLRRWQCFKALAQRHLPQSPDSEALSCFLVPVLRSLSRLKPTMTLEEGIRQATQEWERKSNFDQMVYYEMAEELMAFQAEEEMQFQKMQLMQGPQGLPPPAPLRPDAQGPPAAAVGPQPGHIPMGQQPREPGAPEEIPPEAVQEYMDIMDELLGPAHSATGQPVGGTDEDRKESQLQKHGVHLDPDFLSVFDELCPQEDLVAKEEVDIPPQFLADMLSPEAQQDLLKLVEELLEKEEGLTPVQLEEKQGFALKEDVSVQAPPSHGAAWLNSSPSEYVAGRESQKPDLGLQQRVNDNTCPPDTDCQDRQRHGGADAHLSRPQAFAVSSGPQGYPPLRAQWPPSTPQNHGRTYCRLRPRDASISRETFLTRETHGPGDRSRENEDDLPSLDFLWASPKSLLPCVLSLSPVPASGLACPGGRVPQRAAQSQIFQRPGLSQVSPQASKSLNGAGGGGPALAEKNPLRGADLGVSGQPALALGLIRSSQPQKRKCEQSLTGSWSKRHCSQYEAVGCPSLCQPAGGPD